MFGDRWKPMEFMTSSGNQLEVVSLGHAQRRISDDAYGTTVNEGNEIGFVVWANEQAQKIGWRPGFYFDLTADGRFEKAKRRTR